MRRGLILCSALAACGGKVTADAPLPAPPSPSSSPSIPAPPPTPPDDPQGPLLAGRWLSGSWGAVVASEASIGADFGERPDDFPYCSTCAHRFVGGCVLDVDSDEKNDYNQRFVGAGRVTFAAPATHGELHLGPVGSYHADWSPGAQLRSGDRIDFAATGDVAPAFTGGVRAPREPIALLQPHITSESDVITIPRDRPLEIALPGVNYAEAALSINSIDDAGRPTSFHIYCPVDLVDGKGSVSAEALAALPPGDAGAGIEIRGANVAWVESGAWIIGVFAYTTERFQAFVTLQ